MDRTIPQTPRPPPGFAPDLNMYSRFPGVFPYGMPYQSSDHHNTQFGGGDWNYAYQNVNRFGSIPPNSTTNSLPPVDITNLQRFPGNPMMSMVPPVAGNNDNMQNTSVSDQSNNQRNLPNVLVEKKQFTNVSQTPVNNPNRGVINNQINRNNSIDGDIVNKVSSILSDSMMLQSYSHLADDSNIDIPNELCDKSENQMHLPNNAVDNSSTIKKIVQATLKAASESYNSSGRENVSTPPTSFEEITAQPKRYMQEILKFTEQTDDLSI